MNFWISITLQLILLIIAYILVIRIFYVIHTFRNRVPYVPIPLSALKRMIQVSGIHEGPAGKIVRVVDIGSGTGKMLFHLSRNLREDKKCPPETD